MLCFSMLIIIGFPSLVLHHFILYVCCKHKFLNQSKFIKFNLLSTFAECQRAVHSLLISNWYVHWAAFCMSSACLPLLSTFYLNLVCISIVCRFVKKRDNPKFVKLHQHFKHFNLSGQLVCILHSPAVFLAFGLV